MLKISFTIPAEQVNYLQRLAYEMEGQKRIVKELIVENTMSPNVLEGETYKKFYAQYVESSAAFEVAKSSIEEQYVPTVLRNGTNKGIANWNLQYNMNLITIIYNGDDFDTCAKDIKFADGITDLEIEVLESGSLNTSCGCGGNCAR